MILDPPWKQDVRGDVSGTASASSKEMNDLVKLLCKKNKLIDEIKFECEMNDQIESRKIKKIIKQFN